MPCEVKMPQLGMNQDSALIVAWLKAAGDKVSAGEPIFEVETDKATMEVEAAADGFLAGIRVKEGAEVPVGDVIALIVETEGEVSQHSDATQSAAPETEVSAPPDPLTDPNADPGVSSPAEQAKPTIPSPLAHKVLASPLATRLASERGISLAGLRAAGAPEPIHAVDLRRASTGGQSQLSAMVDGSSLNALLARSENANRTTLLSAFAAGGWRALFDGEDVTISIRWLDGTTTTVPSSGNAPPALTLLDLCDTRVDAVAPAAGGTTLSVGRDDDAYTLTLSFSEGALPLPNAIALLDAIAARVEDPIRQLI